MSFISQLRKKVNYQIVEPAVCFNCANFKPKRLILTENSQTKFTHNTCEKHGMTISPHAVCDNHRKKEG